MRALPRLLPAVLVLVVLAAAIAAACGGGGEDPTPDSGRRSPSPPPAAPQATPTPPADSGSNGPVVGGGKPITVVNEDVGGSGAYAFNPPELTFSVGEAVTFTLTAETEFHTFTVEDLDIDQSLEAGETQKFNFTFDKAGTFSLICLAHPQMTGTITVQ